MTTVALAAAFGVVIGSLLGLVGGGGGILAVPALVYGLGLPLSDAVPGSLVVVGLASLVAALPRVRTDVDWRLAVVVGAAGVPASLLGGVLHHHLDDRWLTLVFAAVMVAAGVHMLRRGTGTGGVCELPDGGVAWRRCLPRAILTGLAVGLLTGLLGVGGGFLLVPALVVALGLRTTTAVATSLVIIVVNSAAALVPYLAAGGLHLPWTAIGPFAVAAVAVSLPAGRLARRLPARLLGRGFAVLVLLVAAGVGVRSTLALLA